MNLLKLILPTLLLMMGLFGCVGAKVTLFTDASDPLMEVTLEGSADDKILVVPVVGVINDRPDDKFMRTMPSPVQEVVSQLRLAEEDKNIKAVIFKIDSPGGTTTASDILYHEIAAFKERSGKKVVVCMMNVVASGGYYISLPADLIVAHPTTVTGSVGVILVTPQISEVMEKIGVDMRVHKSGENKDMGSPFRDPTAEEERILQQVADSLGQRFVQLVKEHRKLGEKRLALVADARVFLAEDALDVGLVDKIGYLPDAIEETKTMGSIDADARIVAYRRTQYPDDNIYYTLNSSAANGPKPLMDMGPIADWLSLRAGFYYIWPNALGAR
jgi:protease-4